MNRYRGNDRLVGRGGINPNTNEVGGAATEVLIGVKVRLLVSDLSSEVSLCGSMMNGPNF